jgi:hypothetical protein
MTNFPKCPRCGYDPNPMYERAIAAADKYLYDTEEVRKKFWDEYFKNWEKENK